MQTAPPDKLLKPPRCGGKSKEKSGFRSAERCLRSLSRQIPAIQMKFPEEDMVFISKSDRLLGVARVAAGVTERLPIPRGSESASATKLRFAPTAGPRNSGLA